MPPDQSGSLSRPFVVSLITSDMDEPAPRASTGKHGGLPGNLPTLIPPTAQGVETPDTDTPY